MSDDQHQRFKFVNYDDPSEHGKGPSNTPANKINQQAFNYNIMGIEGGLGWRQHDKTSLQNSRAKNNQPKQQERQKDRKIRKLTNINKHMLQQLKLQNDELTKRVSKQKFRIPKKSTQRPQIKNQQTIKHLEGLKRQLQNSYRQIQYYKQTISTLKLKQMPTNDKDKLNQMASKLKEKNEEIDSIQQEVKTQKIIKQMQNKELYKINNDQLTDVLKRLQDQIKSSKLKLKQLKRTLNKRQQLEKKQHTYFVELQALIKKKKLQETDNNDTQIYAEGNQKTQTAPQDQISESQWKQLKDKLMVEKKKYQDYGKKLTYHNYMKSKQSKLLQGFQLKYKEKSKILQKLKSKLNEVNKLARIVPKPQILQRVDFKMSKLKDIISRQNTLQLQSMNKVKTRVQSEDVRQFKKWELEHAQRQNDNDESQLKYSPKNQSDYQDSYRLKHYQYQGHGDVRA